MYNSEYLSGDSTIVIGQRHKINPSTLRSRFVRLGLQLRSNKENSRKYQCNEDTFEKIDTPECAYWLGFLAADGYLLDKREKYVGLTLCAKDKEHIEKFKRFTDSTYPIHQYSSNGYSDEDYCRISIRSDKMWDDIVRYGVIPRKTNILKRPCGVPESLIRYFILGYYDGDGSIFVNHTRSPFYTISIVGTDEICDLINEVLLSNKIIDHPALKEKRKPEQVVSYIRFGGNKKVKRILDFLYNGISPDVPLKRKFALYKNCVNGIFE